MTVVMGTLMPLVFYRYHSTCKVQKNLLTRSKADFFLRMIGCKLIARGLATQFKFSKFTIQREKTVLFFHEEAWDDEERFRLRYCLRFLITFKKQNEHTALSSRYNALMGLGAVLRRFKITLTYLRNSLVSDVDRINSRFLIFLYFLTRVDNIFVAKTGILIKKKRILRNLFFIFIFVQERVRYFFGLTSDNPVLAKRSLRPFGSALSVFPKGLFLLLYSPYKVTYRYGSAKLSLAKRETFLQRLDYSRDLIRQERDSKSLYCEQNRFLGLCRSRNFNNYMHEGEMLKLCSGVIALSDKLHFSSSSKYQPQISNSYSCIRKKAGLTSKRRSQCFNFHVQGFTTGQTPFSLLLEHFKRKVRQSKFDAYSNRLWNSRRTQRLFSNILRRFMRNLSFLESRIKHLYLQYGKRPAFFVSVTNLRLMFRQYYRFLNIKGSLFARNTIAYFGMNSFSRHIFSMPKALVDKLLVLDTSLLTEQQYQKEFIRNRGRVSGIGSARTLKKYRHASRVIKLKSIVATVTFRVSRTFCFSTLKVNFLRQLNLGSIFPVVTQFLLKNESFLGASRTYFGQLFRGFVSFKTFSVFLQTKFFLNSKFLKFFFELLTGHMAILSLLRSVSYSVIHHAANNMLFCHYYGRLAQKHSLNSDLDNVFGALLPLYKSSLNEYFDSFFLRSGVRTIKPVLTKLRYINRTQMQVKIIGQHNLRNLESMKDAVKRLAIVLKRSSARKRANLFSDSQVEFLRLKERRSNVRSNRDKALPNLSLSINSLKSRIGQQFSLAFWRSHFLKSGYRVTKRFFRKNVRKLFFRRKIRKFLINSLFLNKFVKEKRIMQSYYGFAKRGMRISRFHKLASPFFLRLRLKRFILVESQVRLKRVLSRFSFAMFSSGLSLAMGKFVDSNAPVDSFLLSQQIGQSSFFVRQTLLYLKDRSGGYSQRSLWSSAQISINLLFIWLSSLKTFYSLFFFRLVKLQKIVGSLFTKVIEYSVILLFFFHQTGSLTFPKELVLFVSEFWELCRFLEELKKFVWVCNIFFSNKIQYVDRDSMVLTVKPAIAFLRVSGSGQPSFRRTFSTLNLNSQVSKVCYLGIRKNVKLFKFIFTPVRVLVGRSHDLILTMFSRLLLSSSVTNNKSEFKRVDLLAVSFARMYLMCNYLQLISLYLILRQKWNFFGRLNLVVSSDTFPRVLYSHVKSMENKYHGERVRPLNQVFSVFLPVHVVGFFTFFYSTIRNAFASYSHFRFTEPIKQVGKRKRWQSNKKKVILRPGGLAHLSSKHVGFWDFYRRRPLIISSFFQKKIERRIETKKQKKLVLVKREISGPQLSSEWLNYKISHGVKPVRSRYQPILHLHRVIKPSSYVDFLPRLLATDSLPYFHKNKDRFTSVQARSLGFVNLLARSTVFSGSLAVQVRNIKFSSILDQVVNRIRIQEYRISRFQQSVILDFKSRWLSRSLDFTVESYFDKLFVRNSGLKSVLFNLKFQRFCRLFVNLVLTSRSRSGLELFKSSEVGGKRAVIGMSDNRSTDSAGPDLPMVFFDYWIFNSFIFSTTGNFYYIIDQAAIDGDLVDLFIYYDDFVIGEANYNNNLGSVFDDLDMYVLPDIFCNDIVANSIGLYEGFYFSVSDCDAIVADPHIEFDTFKSVFESNIPSSLGVEFGTNSVSNVASLSFFASTEFLKFYMYVRNYKFVNNLTCFIIPLSLVKLGFTSSFLQFLHSHRYVYILKESTFGTSYLLISELFMVLLYKFFSLLSLKLLKLEMNNCQHLLICELLEFVNRMCLENSQNMSKGTQLIAPLTNFFKNSRVAASRSDIELKLTHTDLLSVLLNYERAFVLNQGISIQEGFKRLSSTGWSKFTYSLVGFSRYHNTRASFLSRYSNINTDFTEIIGARRKLGEGIFSRKSNLTKIFYICRNRRMLRSHVQTDFIFRNGRIFRRGLRQHLRRHKKRFVYQSFFQFMIDRKLEVARNRQLRFILSYIRLWGRGLFFKFRKSDKLIGTKLAAFVPAKKRFKKRRKTAYVYSMTELQRNPYDDYSKRILYSVRTKRVRLTRRHIFLKTRFPVVLKKKMFVDFFVSPRFFNFRNGARHLYFSQLNLDLILKNKIGLFFKLNRFLEFLVKLAFRVKLGAKQRALVSTDIKTCLFFNNFFDEKSFSSLFAMYRRVKLLILNFMVKLGDSFVRNVYQVNRTKLMLNFSNLRIRFGFFYNYLSLKFFKFFVLRYFFFGDYIRSRLQFIARYLWFRVIPLNTCVLNPKIFVIITKLRNNFFITGIDLFGRILYKTSPGMVKFTGTDRMSKYAWFDASVDFFDGFIEFLRYFLKGRKRKRASFVRWRIVRAYGDRLHGMKRVMGAFFDSRKLDLWKSVKKFKKRRSKQKLKMRRFFVISKGISDFNLRIFRKGMIEQRFMVSRFFAGAVNYPVKSFSLCRIKKVRRI